MRRFAYVFLCALVPLLHATGGEFKLEEGFVLLFNGKNLDGWKEASMKKEPLEGKTEAYKGRFKVMEGSSSTIRA